MAENQFWQKYRDRRWQKKRLRIMERAGFRCEMCGSGDPKQTLNVHHGFYRSKADPWDYPDDTLWCLCEGCHEEAGDHKHDCQVELARINPAFLGITFYLIRAFRSGIFLFDDEGRPNKTEVSESIGIEDAILAVLSREFGVLIAKSMIDYGISEASKQ